MPIPVTLTIAGSDSGGGAGIQADIKAMQANGTFATSVITAITAQNTVAVTDAFELPLSLIASQLDAVLTDFPVVAAKTGMLSSAEIIRTVASKVREYSLASLVVDPVMISKSGYALLRDDAVDALISDLLPLASICTPNAHEAARLVGREIRSEAQAREAAREIHAMGPDVVLVKGGHLDEEEEAVDVLFDGKDFVVFRSERLDTKHTHGTGCTYAATIAARLALGEEMTEAVQNANAYVHQAIKHGLAIGKGHGPTDHFWFLRSS
ncbi:MAG: bifunctional hydroxymethylpyrimidine kinase/phosphomethylpyrimidine kinase [Bacteroidetes bacterium]|nr:bifunctional hydroxymethylpyrimidine kinase/phosphomethylpyrimidine kinase [Bacteroidota bacterium]MDA1334303.1 bifunctional hydroxymethylpyrimidine kinase/phosphomethylpyrimidine kinase [Bacteroidota bacterium]